MATYRAHVTGGKAAGNGDVHLDCQLQKLVDVDTWEDVPNGHRTIVLDGAAILVIVEDSGMTNTQKRLAIAELFRQTVKAWGIDESDDAWTQMDAIISWPQDVNL